MLPLLLSSSSAKYAIAVAGVVLVVAGAYIKGRFDGADLVQAQVDKERAAWQIKIATLQGDADARAQTIATEYNTKVDGYKTEIDKLKKRKLPVKVVTKNVDRIVEKEVVVEKIVEVEKVVNVYIPEKSNCQVNKGFVDLHNTAAQGKPLSEAQKPDAGEASDKKLSDVGETVAVNYYQCNAIREQLSALQKIIADFQAKQKALTK